MDDRHRRFTCTVTGQAFPADEIDDLVQTVVLDNGAEVTICRKHGAPIAVTLAPLTPGSPGQLP